MSRLLFLGLLLASLSSHAAVDPTQPPVDLRQPSDATAPAALNLQAIVRGAQGSRAVIDGRTLRVGESHADLRVLAIHPHSVLIERQGQQQWLRLAQPVVKPSR